MNFGILIYPDHLQNLSNFGHGLLIFLFGFILAKWNRSNLGSLAIFFRMHGRNGMQFDMLMYPDYLFNCSHFGHGLLIFLILAGIWMSERSHICSFHGFSWESIGGIGWTNLVILEEMEKANFSLIKLSSHPVGGIPDCCVVRLVSCGLYIYMNKNKLLNSLCAGNDAQRVA